MAKARISRNSSSSERRSQPALTPEAREAQMISLSESCAEKRLREGTASDSLIIHYLKLGTSRAQMEKEKLALENELIRAKTEEIHAAKNAEESYAEVLKALQIYAGKDTVEEIIEDD